MPESLPGQSERTVTVTLTEHQARHAASYALRENDWQLLDAIEPALRELGLDAPMDVYCEVATLRRQVRDLGGKP